MQVILKEHVENLGQAGDLISVAPGYARNYLLPKTLPCWPMPRMSNN